MKSTSPQLAVESNKLGFSWIDALVLVCLFSVLGSVMHFGKGMLLSLIHI